MRGRGRGRGGRGRGGRGAARGGARGGSSTGDGSARVVTTLSLNSSELSLDKRFSELMKKTAGPAAGTRKRKSDEPENAGKVQRGARGGRVRGGRGRGGKRGGKAAGGKEEDVSKDDLDKQLDEMMGRDHKESVKEDLDNDLDDYYKDVKGTSVEDDA